jgi:RecA-family ATPase
VAVDDEPNVEPYPVVRLSKVARDDRPDWLIEGLWARQGVGVVGGHPKLGKTWVALEMALAIASGQPCFGRFPVREHGPVLVYCVEDGKQRIRDRMAGLCAARCVDFDRLPVGWIDAEEIALDRPGDQLRLHATVGWARAKAIVLDPLVRLHLGDENSSQDISRLLRFLRILQQRHGTAVILVHHTRKAAAAEHGQGLRGSGDVHAWGDSNLYLHKRGEQWVLSTEHRSQPPLSDLYLRLAGDPPYIAVEDHPLAERIVAALVAGPR